MTAFVNGTARSRRAARTSSTDSFTAACAGDAVEVAELVGAEAKRRPDRRIELAHRTAAERLDRVVERPDALHRPVRDLLGERPVARVEPAGRGGEGAVGVGVVLEDAEDDLVGRAPGRGYRSPRSHAS